MIVLDLFCGAGGASEGYRRAGFQIIGVDHVEQPHYPGHFYRGDVFELLGRLRRAPTAVHASPPCQFASQGTKRWPAAAHPNLIERTREALRKLGRPFVIENVAGARAALREPVMLCGTMFDLGVFRHRYFEVHGFHVPALPHARLHPGKIGDGKYFTVAGKPGGSSFLDGWKGGSTEDWGRAMGIHWMTSRELAQAIPPAYTEYIGRHLAAAI